MKVNDAINVIESAPGFTDETTLIGEAWATVLALLSLTSRPAEEEVANEAKYLAKELRDQADDLSPSLELFGLMHNAADFLEQRYHRLVPVSERLPEPNTKVLAHYFNDHGKGRTICAIWVPAKSRSDDADFADDDFTEYDEEDDKFYWPEGWYEAIENWDDFGWIKVYEGEVIYWQPLPAWPALPLLVKEVEK